MKAAHLLAAFLAVVVGGLADSRSGEPSRTRGAARLAAPTSERDVQDVVYLGDKGPVVMRLHVRIDDKPLVDVWENFMGQLFAYLDVDGDGVLSKAEAARVPSIPKLFNNGLGFGAQQPNIAEILDKNQDGKITKQEVTEWFRGNGAAPFQFHTGGSTTQSQFRLVIAGQAEPLSPDALNQKLFALLDANKDGKLSREELARAPAVLHPFDLDDDEMVSVQEMSGNADSNQGTDAAVTFAIAQDAAPVTDGPFMLVQSDEANKELAQRLLNHYGRKRQKTSAKTLTRQELGLDEASFKQLDMDEDGKLDREELARFAQCPPDLELRVRLGKKGDKEAGIEVVSAKDDLSPLAKSIRPGTNGTLRLEFGTAQIELGRADTP